MPELLFSTILRLVLTIGCSRPKFIPGVDHRLTQKFMIVHSCRGFLFQFFVKELFYSDICRLYNKPQHQRLDIQFFQCFQTSTHMKAWSRIENFVWVHICVFQSAVHSLLYCECFLSSSVYVSSVASRWDSYHGKQLWWQLHYLTFVWYLNTMK